MIPCKEFKCLKYPVCRNKTLYNCIELSDYIMDMMVTYEDQDQVFKTMIEHFPNLNPSYKGWWRLRYGGHMR